MTDKPLGRYVLTDELHALLKQKIIQHQLSAGDRINIDKLAKDLGVSNIPIREALFRLASEGFVRNIPFKGMFVAEMSLQDIEEIFEIRIELESLAVRKASGRIPERKLLLLQEDLLKQAEATPSMPDPERNVMEMNRGLHGLILSYADNGNLAMMVTTLIERIYRYLNLYHYEIDLMSERQEHERIIRCLLDKQTDAAVEAMQTHLRHAFDRLKMKV